jgi:CheY-like chemotaxis protein
LKEALKLARSTIPANIEIEQQIQMDCGPVNGDATQVHQIAMNLITNAFHAVEHTDGKINVQLKEVNLEREDIVDLLIAPGRYAMLTVSDTGCGMEPLNIKRIFEPYFTTKEQGKGTGLGLAVVYGIVKEHRGDIKVESELNEGTTFTVYLPLIAKPNDTVSIERNVNYETGNERILLVDDEKPILQVEKQMLERLGYHVTFRTSGLDALETFAANPKAFDMVISDMSMPHMTGDKLAKKLISIRSDIPIVLCTGFSERIDERNADSIGIKGFLMKPIAKLDLAKIVRRVLDEAKGIA